MAIELFERKELVQGFDADEYSIFPYDPETQPEGMPGGYTWISSRWMYFPESGQYEFRIEADDFVTVWIGEDRNSLSMVLNATDFTNGAQRHNVYVTAGMKRVDLRVVNSFFVAGDTRHQTRFVLSVWRGDFPLYISRKDGWFAQPDDFPQDSDITVRPSAEGYLPVLAVEPNWKSGITERLSWFTDVMSSDTNAEQRRALRVLPRRSFTVDFLRQRNLRSVLDNFMSGTGNDLALVPLYHEVVRLTEGTDPTSTGIAFVSIGPAMREIYEGSLVLLTAGDPNVYDVLRVGTVEPLRFSWATPPTRHWPTHTVMYPLRVARVSGVPSMENASSAVGIVRMTFDLEDPELGIPDVVEPSPDQEVLFQFPANWRDRVRYDYNRTIFSHDNQSGTPWQTDLGGDTYINTSIMTSLFGRAEVQRFRRFIGTMRGRARQFFFLDPTDDLIPSEDVGGNELMVEDTSFADYYRLRPQPLRRRIGMLVDDDSAPHYRTIVGIGPNGGLLLDEPFPHVTRDKIIRIAFISPARLDQDSIEFRHHVSLSNAVESRLLIRQYAQRRIELGA